MPKPAIYIPGFPGSELFDKTTGEKLFPPSLGNPPTPATIAKLANVPGDVVAGQPILATIRILAPAAQTLFDILKNNYGYDNTTFIPIGWDWRQSIGSDDTVQRIKKALDTLSPDKSGNVVAILHSTGGLVLRAFLEREPTFLKCFEQVLTFGSPWCGTLASLNVVDKGAPIALGPIKIVSADDSKKILQRSQAAYDLFPLCPDLELYKANGQFTTPIDDLSWIPQDPGHDFMRTLAASAHKKFPQQFDDLPLTNVCGWGGDTFPLCENNGGTLTFSPPINEAGDGTVPFVSSSWLQGANVRTMPLPVGAYGDALIPQYHGQLWMPTPVRQLFNEVLQNAARKPFVAGAADKDQYIAPQGTVRIRIAAVAADGSPLPNGKAQYRLGPAIQTLPFGGHTRMNIDMPREAFQQQPAPNLRRMEIEIHWDGGGPAKFPVLIQV